MEQQTPYIPKNKVRIVTAASLFDGHDAAINIMRRIIQPIGKFYGRCFPKNSRAFG